MNGSEQREKRIVDAVATSWRRAGEPDLPAARSDEIRKQLLAAAGAASAAGRPAASGTRPPNLRVAAVALPLAAAAAVALLILEPWAGPRIEGKRLGRQPLPIAAAAPKAPPAPPAAPAAEETVIHSPADGTPTALDLPGLGRIVLLERAVARLATEGDHVELVLERGAVVASVDKRERERSFFVTTAAGRVEVVGTVFSVAIEDGVTRVAVAEGRVLATPPDGGAASREIGAGEELALEWPSPPSRAMAPGSRERIRAALGTEGETAAMKRSAGGAAKGADPERSTAELDAWFDEAEALLKAGREGDALAVYSRIRGVARGDLKADAAFAIGQIHYRSGDAAACEKAFVEAMPLFIGTPYHAGAQSYLAKCRDRLARGQ